MALAAAPPRSKTIRVYRNGDTNFPGRSVCVNLHQTRNWETFLDKITVAVRPQFGTVFKLYDPSTAHVVRYAKPLLLPAPFPAVCCGTG
jgi:hypothetical protein